MDNRDRILLVFHIVDMGLIPGINLAPRSDPRAQPGFAK